MEHLSHARHALRKLSRHAGGPQSARRALHRGHPRLAAQRCGRQGRGEGDRYRQAHLRLQPSRRYSDDRARAGGAGDRAGRPLHRYLRGVQRAAVQGGDARSAHHRGRELLRRRHAGEPPPRARDDEDVPDQGRQRLKKKGKRPAWEELRKEVPPKTFVKSAECNRIAGNFNISEDYIMDKTIFEQMGGTYHQEGDYFLPDLPPPESIPVGVWGQRRRQYLKTQRRVIYTGLLLSGKLDGHLAEIDAQAEAMLFQLVNQLAEQEGITEQLKAENQMEWVQRMNNIRNRVEEIIYNDLIYI